MADVLVLQLQFSLVLPLVCQFVTISFCFYTMNGNIQTTRLKNGLTILTEKMPDVRSATLGFWIKRGSRHEPADLNGISHFIEHAVFKGTAKRTALDIAKETDRLGGNLDAFTMHEAVGFMAKVIDTQTANAFDLIADMLVNPLFEEKELRREQKVIIEEIKMVEDTPEDILSEVFTKEFFPENALGLPIEGTRKTVRTFNYERTKNFHAETFQPQNIIIACAGNVEHAEIEKLAGKFFGVQSSKFKVQSLKHEVLNLRLETLNQPTVAAPIIVKKKQNLEQAHLIIAVPWISSKDKRRYAASLLIGILGDGNSSRLWQTIREKRGLAYSVGASANSFEDLGVFSIYAGCSPDKILEVVDLSIAELKKIKREGVSIEELNLAKEQTVASVLLGLEDSSVRAANLAQMEITHGRQISVEETLAKVEAVTIEEIREIAREFFRTENIAVAALGNLSNLTIKRERLEVS
jgi:predicted Zn-dependent peptidase